MKIIHLLMAIFGAGACYCGTIPIDTSTNQPLHNPKSAYNFFDKQFLVVWEHRIDSTNWNINGQLMGMEDDLIGPMISIAYSGSGSYKNPDVAFDLRNKRYLVTYTHAPDDTHEMEAAFVGAEGSVIDRFDIADSTYHSYIDSALIYNAGCHEYAMAILDEQHDGDYYLLSVIRMDENGRKLDALWIPLYSMSGGRAISNPAISSSGGQYLVVWQEVMENGDSDIRGQLIQGNEPRGDVINIGHAYASQSNPTVTYNSATGQFYVVWQALNPTYDRYMIHGRLVNPDGLQGLIYTVAGDKSTHMISPDAIYSSCCQNTFLVTWAQGPYPSYPSEGYGIAARRMEWDSTWLSRHDPFWIAPPGKYSGISNWPAVTLGDCCNPLVVWQNGKLLSVGGDITYTIKGYVGSAGEIKGDLNCDYKVDLEDLSIFSESWLEGR